MCQRALACSSAVRCRFIAAAQSGPETPVWAEQCGWRLLRDHLSPPAADDVPSLAAPQGPGGLRASSLWLQAAPGQAGGRPGCRHHLLRAYAAFRAGASWLLATSAEQRRHSTCRCLLSLQGSAYAAGLVCQQGWPHPCARASWSANGWTMKCCRCAGQGQACHPTTQLAPPR